MNRYLIFLITIVVLAVIAFAVRVPIGPDVAEARQQIERALPMGSTAEDVIVFLDSKGMEHSKYLLAERQINANIGVVSKGLFSETSLFAEFHFDTRDRLKSFAVETVSTGL